MFPAYALDFSSIISISVLFSLILSVILCLTKHYRKIVWSFATACD